MLGKLSRHLGNGRPIAPVPGLLRPIDVDTLARELDVEALGGERGSKELPGSSEASLDAVENSIVQRVLGEWSWHGDQLLKEIQAYTERIASFSARTAAEKLRVLANDAISSFRHANHEAEADLGPLKDRFLGARAELRQFQKKNRLERPAREVSGRITTWGLLVFLIAIEAAINGVFFAKGSQLGYVGGISTAVAISAVNVIFAFALGLWPARWVNHRNVFITAFGFIVLLAGVALIVGVHFFAVHYREAMAAVGEERAFNVALETIRKDPIKVNDLNSIYLFALGCLFALLALLKGYKNDDPYPRYGATHRRAETARNEYSDAHLDLFSELEELREDVIAAIKSGLTEIPLYAQQADQNRARRAETIERFRIYEPGIENAANQLLQRYRDANRSARETEAPRYFSSKWTLPGSFVSRAEALGVDAPSELASDTEIKEILTELRVLSDNVLREYDELIKHYPHPTGMA